jgi:hypothetical protein
MSGFGYGCWGIMLSTVVLISTVGLIIYTAFTRIVSNQVGNNRQAIVEEFIQAANEKNYEKMDTLLWVPLVTMDSIEQKNFTKYCAKPAFVREGSQGALIFIYMKCENETGERKYELIEDGSKYKIAAIAIGGK